MTIFAEIMSLPEMKITAKHLAEMTGGTLEGDGEIAVSGFAKIEEAGPEDLSFIANPKYGHFASTTKAGVLLVGRDFVAPQATSSTLVRVDDPYSTLGMLLRMVADAKPKPSGVESPVFIGDDTQLPEKIYLGAFSYIGKNVKIGENVKIYPQCFVGDNCVIGNDSILYPGVKVYEGCKIGQRCILHSGVVIGADGFGFAPVGDHYEKIPQLGGVTLEDDVEIGANTTVDRATFGNTVVGKGTKLDNLIQIAHNVKIGKDNVFAAQSGVAGSTIIGDRNMIGGQCGFAGHIKIGNGNEFGAQSGIPGHVGDNNRLIGYPAVDRMQFAKNAVYLKRLEELFKHQKENK